MSSSIVASATPTAVESPAPLFQAVPSVIQVLSFLVAIITITASITLKIVTFIIEPLLHLSPLPLILYILSPIIVIADILLDALILTPARVISTIAGIVYPLYVLLGVACLSGAVMGVSGRALGRFLNALVYPPSLDDEASEALRLLAMQEEKRRPSRRRTRAK